MFLFSVLPRDFRAPSADRRETLPRDRKVLLHDNLGPNIHFFAMFVCLMVCDVDGVTRSVQSLLSKPDSWKSSSSRSLDDDEDDEAWFDEEDDELLSAAGPTAESLATPCMIAARLSPDCDQINQYLDKGSSAKFFVLTTTVDIMNK